MDNIRTPLKIAFSGRLRTGKDYVAQQCGLGIIGFADPMYIICERLLGTCDKARPGVREMLQKIGQIGWGCVNDLYPETLERQWFSQMVKEEALALFHNHPLYASVDWSEFGKRKDFWVNILLARPDVQGDDRAETGIGVVNARFYHELDPLRQAGFHHYHVKCSLATRQKRIGPSWNAKADADTSEAMAADLDATMPDSRVIWNDDEVPMPLGVHYLSLSEFVSTIKAMKQVRHIGLAYRPSRMD